MIPRIPMRGLRSVIVYNLPLKRKTTRLLPACLSALAVVIFVAPVQRVDLAGWQWLQVAVRPRDVHGAGRVLAHHRRLDGLPRGRPDGQHAMAAHEHGRRAVALQRGDDAAADLVPADQRERPDRDLAAE